VRVVVPDDESTVMPGLIETSNHPLGSTQWASGLSSRATAVAAASTASGHACALAPAVPSFLHAAARAASPCRPELQHTTVARPGWCRRRALSVPGPL